MEHAGRTLNVERGQLAMGSLAWLARIPGFPMGPRGRPLGAGIAWVFVAVGVDRQFRRSPGVELGRVDGLRNLAEG